MTQITVVRELDHVQGMLHKSVMALAIVPTNRSLTVTGRKAYNVMLDLAQLQVERAAAATDGEFSAPLNTILKGFGASGSIVTDAKRYLDQMVSTTMEWRPLSRQDEQFAPTTATDDGVPTFDVSSTISEELRVFNLLSEVRFYKRSGENWVSWFYPPSILNELVTPSRWARLDFKVLSELTTYAAVALYEICARYRDNPRGLTSRWPWTWWVDALRSSPASKRRVWRKFKSEFVMPAIAEINASGDIEIELIEFRRGREVELVQFSVRKSSRRLDAIASSAVSSSVVLAGVRLGVRTSDMEAMEREFGQADLASALVRFERVQGAPSANQVANAGAYLRAIIINQARERATRDSKPGEDTKSLGNAQSSFAAGPTRPQTLGEAQFDEKERRMQLIRAKFAELTSEQRSTWARQMAEADMKDRLTSPGIQSRLARGEWQSPLIKTLVLNFYAQVVFGEDWPNLDLADFESALAAARSDSQVA
jgi:hypothetical protein